MLLIVYPNERVSGIACGVKLGTEVGGRSREVRFASNSGQRRCFRAFALCLSHPDRKL
jgi:hypothetical protein